MEEQTGEASTGRAGGRAARRGRGRGRPRGSHTGMLAKVIRYTRFSWLSPGSQLRHTVLSHLQRLFGLIECQRRASKG